MLKRLMMLLAGSSLLFCATLRADAPSSTPIVLMTENFPPYNMAANNKNFAREENLSGIAVEIVQEMFKRAGVGYTMTLRFPWSRIYDLALTTPDYGVFVTARLPEREKSFKWVGPIGPDDWIMLARADSPITLNSLDEARRYSVGAYKDDAIAEHLQAQGIEAVTALRDQENARKLQEGKIDLWATGDPAGRYLARQEGVTGLKTVLRFNTAELFLALNPSVPDEVVSKLQQALDKMRSEGFVDAVMKRYL